MRSVRRKLFAAMAGIIAGMCFIFILITLFVVDGAIKYMRTDNVDLIRIGIGSSVTFFLVVFAVLFLLVSLLVAYWVARKITAPLRAIVPAIEALGQGDFSVRAPVASEDEYGRIAQSFNAMSAQLQRAEEVRRKLVADVAHELRTPLAIVRGQLELIQQNGDAVEPHRLLPLQDELIRLTRLVDDLHQLSLAEARRLVLESKPAPLGALLRSIADRYQDAAEARGITLELTDLAPDAEISMDAGRMTQVFLNLLGNAVRYTPDGGSVRMRIETEPGALGDNGDALKTTISDSGPGIPAEHLPYIFDRFYRTDEARSRNSGGMGLGLAIAKELVAAHNGTIEAQSAPGAGTAFIVRLPLYGKR